MSSAEGSNGDRSIARSGGGFLTDGGPGAGYDPDMLGNGFGEAEDRFDPLKLLLYVVQYRWLIASILAVALVTGIVVTFMQTPQYRAAGQIEVMAPTAKVLADLNVVDQTSDLRAYETARQRLMSRDVAQRVVQTLGLSENRKFLFPRPDFSVSNIFNRAFGVSSSPSLDSLTARQRERRAIGHVLSGLSVDLVRNTSILSVSFSDPDPQLAADVANQVVKSYMDQQVDQTVATSDLARQFIQQKVNDAKQKLAKSEQALVDYAKKAGITASEKDGSLIASNIQSLNTALAQAIQDRLDKERLVKQIKDGQGPYMPSVMEDQGIQDTRAQITKLNAEYAEKRRTFKPDYPGMRTLKARIDGLHEQLDQQVKAITDSIRLDYQDAINKENDLRKKLSELEQQQVAFQDKNIQYTILKREADSNRSQYKALVDKLNSLGVSDLRQTNIDVVDAAVVPGAPYSPRLSLNVVLAVAMGGALSAAIIYLLELLNNKFNIPDQVEAELHLPVLGIFPRLDQAEVDEALADPRSPLAEAFRSLRTSMQFAGPDGAPRSLAITSAEPGETKTTTAYKLAEEFGAIGTRVLVIDADMRRPSLHRFFNADNTIGLSNILTNMVAAEEIQKVFQRTQFPNVTFLASGPLVPNPPDLLSSQRMANIIHACTQKFDMVILDGPPVIGLSDSPIIARLAEASLMTVAAHKVSRKSARVALKRLRATGGNVVGASLAMFAIDRIEYSYAYRYMNDGYYAYRAEAEQIEDNRPEGIAEPAWEKAKAAWSPVARFLGRRVPRGFKRGRSPSPGE